MPLLSNVFAPVHTILPELNIKALVLGSLILITRPGNCSGLYSVLGIVLASFVKGIGFSRDVVATQQVFEALFGWVDGSELCSFRSQVYAFYQGS